MGLAAGFVEMLLLVARVELQEGGFFLRSRHFVWMVPASVLAIFAALGAIGAVATTRGGDRARRLVLGSYIFAAVFGWALLVRGLEAAACGLIALGVAWRAAPLLDVRRELLGRWVDRGLPALAAAMACLVAACFLRDAREAAWRRVPASPPPDARNVLLVVLDTVRADRLSLYGYGRETTPHLARLAAESTVFEQARAGASWTLPSHATMFTGLWPGKLDVERRGWLDAAAPTLAERLRDAGLDTGGFVANPFFCGRESGLGRGFQVYADYPITPGEVFRSSACGWLLSRSWLRLGAVLSARATTGSVRDVDLDFSRKDAATVGREFLGWLDRRGGRPFFAFLNFFDAHDPYIPPAGAPSRFADGSHADTPHLLRDWQRVDKSRLTPADARHAGDAYDDCLVALDAQLGALVEALRTRGILDRTILIITADHGEQFGEHGSFGHGLSLYDEEVRVPLLIRAPGLAPAGRVVAEEAGLRDLAATAMELAAAPAPLLPGRSLVRLWDGSSASASPAFSELRGPVDERYATRDLDADDPPGSWKSVVVGGWCYIRRGDGREAIYELATDPGQAVDRRDDPAAADALDAGRRAMDAALGDR